MNDTWNPTPLEFTAEQQAPARRNGGFHVVLEAARIPQQNQLILDDDTTPPECRKPAIAMRPMQFVSLLTKAGIYSNETMATIRVNRKDGWPCQLQFFLDHLFFILALQLINIQIRFIYQRFSWKRCSEWNSENNEVLTNRQKHLALHTSPQQHFCPGSAFWLSADWICQRG